MFAIHNTEKGLILHIRKGQKPTKQRTNKNIETIGKGT